MFLYPMELKNSEGKLFFFDFGIWLRHKKTGNCSRSRMFSRAEVSIYLLWILIGSLECLCNLWLATAVMAYGLNWQPRFIIYFWVELNNKYLYKFTVRLLEPGHLEKNYIKNQNVTWEQRIAIYFLNKPITLKNTNNRFQQNWKPNKMRGAVNFSGNFAICWLVKFDLKFCTLFNGFVFFLSV